VLEFARDTGWLASEEEIEAFTDDLTRFLGPAHVSPSTSLPANEQSVR